MFKNLLTSTTFSGAANVPSVTGIENRIALLEGQNLDQRINSNLNSISLLTARTSSLEGLNIDNRIISNFNAIVSLNSRTTSLEGLNIDSRFTALSTRTTNLENLNIDSRINSNSSAITSLATRTTSLEGLNIDSRLTSNFNSIQSLGVRVVSLESGNFGNRITTLEGFNSGSRLTTLESLNIGTRLTTAETNITAIRAPATYSGTGIVMNNNTSLSTAVNNNLSISSGAILFLNSSSTQNIQMRTGGTTRATFGATSFDFITGYKMQVAPGDQRDKIIFLNGGTLDTSAQIGTTTGSVLSLQSAAGSRIDNLLGGVNVGSFTPSGPIFNAVVGNPTWTGIYTLPSAVSTSPFSYFFVSSHSMSWNNNFGQLAFSMFLRLARIGHCVMITSTTSGLPTVGSFDDYTTTSASLLPVGFRPVNTVPFFYLYKSERLIYRGIVISSGQIIFLKPIGDLFINGTGIGELNISYAI
jgi:hypothetical protein